MADPRLTDGLLNVALVAGGVLVLVLLYGFASRTFVPRTTPTREVAEDLSRIKVEVRNASAVDGLASRTTAHLRRRGFDVVGLGNADRQPTSTVVVRAGTPGDARHVAQALGLAPEAVVTGGPANDYALDVTVTLGADYPALAPFDRPAPPASD